MDRRRDLSDTREEGLVARWQAKLDRAVVHTAIRLRECELARGARGGRGRGGRRLDGRIPRRGGAAREAHDEQERPSEHVHGWLREARWDITSAPPRHRGM